MPEFITIEEKIERRTYLKGHFKGKFIGYLDENASDLKKENFYDLEFLETNVTADKADFRIWQNGDEFEEFSPVEKFLTKLPNTIPCEIIYADGNTKHFNLLINEPKLKDYKLLDQLYEQNKMFATLEGEISGYLKHYDTVERKIEIIPPKIETKEKSIPEEILPKIEIPSKRNVKATEDSSQKNDRTFLLKTFEISRADAVAPEIEPTKITGERINSKIYHNSNGYQQPLNSQQSKADWDAVGKGCFYLVGAVIAIYLIFAFIVLIILGVSKLITGIGILILPSFISSILPVAFVGIIFYLFIKVQNKLSIFGRGVFRLIIIICIFLFWFD